MLSKTKEQIEELRATVLLAEERIVPWRESVVLRPDDAYAAKMLAQAEAKLAEWCTLLASKERKLAREAETDEEQAYLVRLRDALTWTPKVRVTDAMRALGVSRLRVLDLVDADPSLRLTGGGGRGKVQYIRGVTN